MEARCRISELPRNFHLYDILVFYSGLVADISGCRGTSRAQWFLASKSVFHRRRAESESACGPRVLAAGCELLLVDRCTLPESEELYQSHGWEQTTYPSMVVPGGS